MTSRRVVCAVALGAASIGFALVIPAGAAAQAGEARQQSREIATADVAAQLGAKLSPRQPDELLVGTSITASLVDSAKLAALGASGLHPGARVTAMRIGLDRVRVEVDEMEPVALTKKLTLRIDGQGRLSVLTP